MVLEHNKQLSKSKQSNAPNLLSRQQNNTTVYYNRSFELIQKLKQYYYRDAFYFLNKNQTINIPSNNKILPGNSKDKNKDIFNKPFLTLISKNNSKGNNKGRERQLFIRKRQLRFQLQILFLVLLIQIRRYNSNLRKLQILFLERNLRRVLIEELSSKAYQVLFCIYKIVRE